MICQILKFSFFGNHNAKCLIASIPIYSLPIKNKILAINKVLTVSVILDIYINFLSKSSALSRISTFSFSGVLSGSLHARRRLMMGICSYVFRETRVVIAVFFH